MSTEQVAVAGIAALVLLVALAAAVLRVVRVARDVAESVSRAARALERAALERAVLDTEEPRERLWRETFGAMIHALVRNGGDESALRAPRLGQLAKTIADIAVRQYDGRHKLEAPPPALVSVAASTGANDAPAPRS